MTQHDIINVILTFWFRRIYFVVFPLCGVTAITVVIQLHRILFKFRKKYPEIASREIPYVFDDLHRHTEKGLYFYREKAIPVLKQDNELWEMRQRIILLTKVAFALPIGFILISLILFALS